ncbi:MAG: hypothetical protein ACM3SS_01025 [Rhodospirillaceae bacterium]
MSLSWPNRLYVALSPARVDVMRVAGLMRRSAEYAELIPGIELVRDAPWRGAVQALAEGIAKLAPRGGRCAIVLSNHFCRYAVIAGDTALAEGREMEAYARLKFEETYGAGAAQSWEVRVGKGAPGSPRLACAIDQGLMEELRRTCSAAKLRLASVRPLLAASFDESRSRLTGGHFWFASAEEGRLCLAAIENHAWRSVTSQRIGRNFSEELRAMLDRALVSSPGMTMDKVYLFSRDHSSERAAALPGITVLPPACSVEHANGDELARERVFA